MEHRVGAQRKVVREDGGPVPGAGRGMSQVRREGKRRGLRQGRDLGALHCRRV